MHVKLVLSRVIEVQFHSSTCGHLCNCPISVVADVSFSLLLTLLLYQISDGHSFMCSCLHLLFVPLIHVSFVCQYHAGSFCRCELCKQSLRPGVLVLFSSIVLFARDCFGYLISFVDLYEFEGFIFYFYEQCHGDLDSDCIESVGGF